MSSSFSTSGNRTRGSWWNWASRLGGTSFRPPMPSIRPTAANSAADTAADLAGSSDLARSALFWPCGEQAAYHLACFYGNCYTPIIRAGTTYRGGIIVAQDGQEIAGYKLLKKIGEGGMGQVFLAEQLRLHRQVAIKLVHLDVKPDEPEAAEPADELTREAEALRS